MPDFEKNVVYGMVSGLALLMDVYRPLSSKHRGIVYINGSGWHSALSYDAAQLKEAPLGMPYIEKMVANGYTVFAINHRQEPRFRYPAAIEDAQRAVRFVRHNATAYDIDPDHIGACGGSSGGHLVSLLGTLGGEGSPEDPDPVERESAAVQCVVARAPILDLARVISSGAGVVASTADFMGMTPRGEAGALTTEGRTYAEASPITHVSKNTPPFLLIHGSEDVTVPYDQSEIMLDALQSAGVASELLPIPFAGHGPNFPGANDPPDYLGAVVRWFDEHLSGA